VRIREAPFIPVDFEGRAAELDALFDKSVFDNDEGSNKAADECVGDVQRGSRMEPSDFTGRGQDIKTNQTASQPCVH
jgi:hypothetical protein